jgi:hypothetical protein
MSQYFEVVDIYLIAEMVIQVKLLEKTKKKCVEDYQRYKK